MIADIAPSPGSTDGAIAPSRLRFSRGPKGELRLTVTDDRSYLKVRVVKAAPLSFPDRYVAILDHQNKEICMIEALGDLDAESQALVREALGRYYLVHRLTGVRGIGGWWFGPTYWEVETDRGPREFVLRVSADTVIPLSARGLLLIDVDGNRFEIPDVAALDQRSQAALAGLL